MGVRVYINELKTQSMMIEKLAEQAIEQSINLRNVVNELNQSDQLCGKSYDSAKQYFNTVYGTLSRGLELFNEELIVANQALVNKYIMQFGNKDLDEDYIIDQIYSLKSIIGTDMDPYGDYSYNTVHLLEGMIDQLRNYDQYSATLFTEALYLFSLVQKGICAIESNQNWDGSTKTFEMSSLNLSWVNEVLFEYDYHTMSDKEKYVAHLGIQYGFDESELKLMMKLYEGIEKKFPNYSDREIAYLFNLILGRLKYGDFKTGDLKDTYQWNNTAGNPLMYFLGSQKPLQHSDEFEISMFEKLGLTEQEFMTLRYKIRMQSSIASDPSYYTWSEVEKNKNFEVWKEMMRKALGYSEEEFTKELFEKLWKSQYEAYLGKGDFAHQAILTATILRNHPELSDLYGGKGHLNTLAGWKGDATNVADADPSLGPDDYIADLDATNITYLMSTHNYSYMEAVNQYYDHLGKDYTRADLFLEHTSLSQVRIEIFESLKVETMEELKSVSYDSYRFIKNLVDRNNELEDYE